MKWKSRLTVLGAGLLVLVFLVYLGIQITANLGDQIVTVEALEVTVEEKVSAEGAFLREQTPVSGTSGGGWAEYLTEDGDKVAVGERIAVYFSTEESAQQYQECEKLRDRLSALEYAYENITSGADSQKMDELIWRQIVSVNDSLSLGEAAHAESKLAQLDQLVISRSASKEDKEQFEEQISSLKTDLRTRENALSGSNAVRAPASGYFLSSCDGYSTLLGSSRKAEVTPEELLNTEYTAENNTVGCIVNAFEWYFAAVVDKAEADVLREMKEMDVYYPELSSSALHVQVENIRNCENGQYIVLLRSGVMDTMYLSARRQTVDLVVGSYTGIKVPAEALRQVDGKWGVYVLDGSVSRFKPVTWSYQTESYFLVPCAASSDDGLYRYDRIILRAKGLEDNKVLK